MGFLTILKIFYSYILPIISFFKNAKEHPIKTAIVSGLIVLALAGWGVKHQFDKHKETEALLMKEKVVLEQQKAQLKIDVANVVAANKENQNVINTLTQKQIDDQRHLAELSTKQKVTVVTIEKIQKAIENSSPSDDGPLAKVLADTVQSIQEEREIKQ